MGFLWAFCGLFLDPNGHLTAISPPFAGNQVLGLATLLIQATKPAAMGYLREWHCRYVPPCPPEPLSLELGPGGTTMVARICTY